MILNNVQKSYQNKVDITQNYCSYPVFKAKIPKTAEKEITEDALKIASAAIAASGIVYVGTEKNPSKLSRKQQEEVIEKYKSGITSVALAKEYSCSKPFINKLIARQPNHEELKRLNAESSSKFSPKLKADIMNMYASGSSYDSIADKYKCNRVIVWKIINEAPNKKELMELHKQNGALLSDEQKNEIFERFAAGESAKSISKDFSCCYATIKELIKNHPNIKELKAKNKANRKLIKPEQVQVIIQRFINGESAMALSKYFNCSKGIIQILINEQPNADQLKALNRENRQMFSPEQKKTILKKYINGNSFEIIAREYDCDTTTIIKIIDEQPNAKELRKISKSKRGFSEEQKKEIVEKYKSGFSLETIAKEYDCGRGAITTIINQQPNSKELRELSKSNRKFSSEQKEEIIIRYINGEGASVIAADFSTYGDTVRRFLMQQTNWEEIKVNHQNNQQKLKYTLTAEQKHEIIQKFIAGEGIGQLAIAYKCNFRILKKLINKQENIVNIMFMHKQNRSVFNDEKRDLIIKRYRNGEASTSIARDLDCSSGYVYNLIYKQPEADDIRAEREKNSARYTEEQINDILTRSANGESDAVIARRYKCYASAIWRIVQKELNKNKEGTTKETFWNKYEQYTIDELKTRISECVSLKQVEENDELLEIMFFLDEKAKFSEDEKALSIDFIRLLDKLEQQKTSMKNIEESQTIKDLFDLIDKDLIRQQIFEALNKDFSAVLDDLNSKGNFALADICSKYIAHDIGDEDKITSMKEILNILSANDEKSARHKLVIYDTAKVNSNDERIKEAQEIYGKDNQEKIGQYIIFDQVLNGECTYTDINNNAWLFADTLKNMHLNKDAIIKRLIELEDYFNSKEAENNSLTNFVKHFNLKDNYINKLITDFYIDNIYKDQITTYTGIADPDKRYFGGKEVTVIIYPESKQKLLNYDNKGKWDKHEFLIDSDKYAQSFANAKYGTSGLKLFTLTDDYNKDGFYKDDMVTEIKVSKDYDGARLVAKRKGTEDRLMEIRYFLPKGFHKEKKRTDLK